MLTHICIRCGFRSNLYHDWTNHLLETFHQDVIRKSFLSWSDEDDLKSLVVYAHRNTSPTPVEVAAKFRTWSNVVDFLYWDNVPRLFVVQFETKEDVEKLLENLRKRPDEMKIGGQCIQLRRKSDVLQNEWPILIEVGTITREAEQVCIELSSDDENTSGRETQTNGTQNDTPAADEEFEEITLMTKMGKQFRNLFLSKFKPENTSDDKSNVRETLDSMRKKWLNIYLEFHDHIWPICFAMANFEVEASKRTSKTDDTSHECEATIICECLKSDINKWLRDRVDDRDAFVKGKVAEFHEVLMNGRECKRRMEKLVNFSRRGDNPILNFTCRIIVDFFGEEGAKATAKFTKISGKNYPRKMILVTSIFKKLFKEFEILKLKKWSSANASNEAKLVSSKKWTLITLE